VTSEALPKPDWTPVRPFPFAGARKTFTGPEPDADRLSLRYFKRPDGCLVALAEFGPLCEGAPGQVHGGTILTVLDEALGAAAWIEGHPVLTVRLNTEFRKSVPVGAKLLVRTRLTGVRRTLVFVEGELVNPDGDLVCARAEGVFFKLDEAGRKRLER
jgi:acyl-coenzyme A thioesterase PaaI-like protein